MLTFNGKILLSPSDKWLERTQFHVTTYGQFGTVTATPNSGYAGESVSLTNIPDSGYAFDHYAIEGATLSGNTFNFYDSDVAVTGYFTANAYSITYDTVVNGSFSGPASATVGTLVTVTATPDNGFSLDYITVNGVQIQGRTFTMPAGNVTISGHFYVVQPAEYKNMLVFKFASAFDPRNISNGPSYDEGQWTQLSATTWKLESVNYLSWIDLHTDDVPFFEVMYGTLTNGSLGLESNYRLKKVHDLTIIGVSTSPNQYSADGMFRNCSNLEEADITLQDIKFAALMFDMDMTGEDWDDPASYQTSLKRITIHQTGSKVIDAGGMFEGCAQLEWAPYVEFASTTSSGYSFSSTSMYNHCFNVEGGILDMYNQLKDISGLNHTSTFHNCGTNTISGAAELAQIPSDWKE